MPYTAGKPRIHFETLGAPQAPPLLMLRGLGRAKAHWGRVVGELAPRFRLVLLDNRGVGLSDAPRAPFAMGALARDALDVLDALGIARAHVFGMSLGGMIAQHLAIAHPNRVDRLVLGCTTPGGPEAERPRLSAFARLAQARMTSIEAAIQAEGEMLLSDRGDRDHPEVIEEWIAIAKREPVAKRSLLLQMGAAIGHRAGEGLGRITAPTLVVSGDDDPLIPVANSRLLARRIRGAELAWIAGARHDFATEAPGELGRLLREFLLPADGARAPSHRER
ncbi:MAG: alpha/beta fold hydrolase [Myxococcales bacterium]|nr:alpha/beta fold hydrolase [Myxococcales bacterium]